MTADRASQNEIVFTPPATFTPPAPSPDAVLGDPGEPVSRSSVKITLNAKREAQVEVKVYVGDTVADVHLARDMAIDTYRQTVAAVTS